MPLPSQPKRDITTQISYANRARALQARCLKELKIHKHEELDPRQLVGWLVTKKTQWSRPTWRQYKAAIAYKLELESENNFDPVAQEALESLMKVDVEGCPSSTKKTSGSKMKRFPMRDFRKILNALEYEKHDWSGDLENWLIAGLLTGLRPGEWARTKYFEDESGPYILVQNAKKTNGRAHGPTRTILLDGLNNSERNTIKEHISRANIFEHANDYKRFYHACAAILSRLTRRLWPKRTEHVTLYSTRHQFSANAKASGLLPEELAALMGHAVDTTAVKHYGKKVSGNDIILVRPNPEEVAKVRSTLKYSYDLRQKPMPKMRPLPQLNNEVKAKDY